MEPNIYKRVFNIKYKGGIIDVEGIKVKLIDITEDDNQTPPYTLNFEMVNPMNLSYTRLALIANIEDELDSLNHMTQTPYYSVVNVVNSQKIYLGDDIVDEKLEECDDSMYCMFEEIFREEYVDKPKFYIDDRWYPDIDKNNYNDYLAERLAEI